MLRNATPRFAVKVQQFRRFYWRDRFNSEGASVTIAYYAAFRVVLCRIGSPFYGPCELG
jgi:hypothetical protein